MKLMMTKESANMSHWWGSRLEPLGFFKKAFSAGSSICPCSVLRNERTKARHVEKAKHDQSDPCGVGPWASWQALTQADGSQSPDARGEDRYDCPLDSVVVAAPVFTLLIFHRRWLRHFLTSAQHTDKLRNPRCSPKGEHATPKAARGGFVSFIRSLGGTCGGASA